LDKKIRESFHYPLDILIFFLFSLVLFVLITGGGNYCFFGINLSIHHISTPLAILFFLIVLRYEFFKERPFLGIGKLNTDSVYRAAYKSCENIFYYLRGLEPRKALRIIFLIIAVSTLIKLLNAYFYFGFFSGDGVEIHEMTFSHLHNWNWEAWNLRNPFFPMFFIFPIQKLLFYSGVQDASILIFAGRLIVILFSILNLWLVYKISRRLFESIPVGILSLFFLAISKLHTAFASSELPRTVASTFILLGLWFLASSQKRKISLFLAGAALAAGASVRFSEMIFLVPAVLYLFLNKRYKDSIVLTISFAITFAFIIGLSDWLYWGEAFFSLINIVDYTLINKMSSRGFEPLLYYISNFGTWTNFCWIGLFLISLKLNTQKIYIWAIAPLVMLSLLPHKEPRYLVPVIPFFAVMAASSLWHLLKQVCQNKLDIQYPQKFFWPSCLLTIVLVLLLILSHKDFQYLYLAAVFFILILLISLFQKSVGIKNFKLKILNGKRIQNPAMVIVVLFLGCIIFEVNGFHFQRSESGIQMARYLANQTNVSSVAIQQIWRAGGKLYLWKIPKLDNINEKDLHDKQHFQTKYLNNGYQWLALKKTDVKRYEYDFFLSERGFKEVAFSQKKRKDSYQLFFLRKSDLD